MRTIRPWRRFYDEYLNNGTRSRLNPKPSKYDMTDRTGKDST